ncbi:hypothetical protein VPH35_125871 [Triticum aestivum]
MAGAAGLEAEVTAGWETVRSRRPRRPALQQEEFKARAPPSDWLFNLCFHCLHPRHKAATCRNLVTCRRCFRSGHRARGCTNPLAPHLRPRAPPRRQALPARQCLAPPLPRARSPPPAPARAMAAPVAAAWAGDHTARPAEVFTVVHSTPAMVHEAALLESNAVVAWLEREMRASSQEIAAAVVREIGCLRPDVNVARHFPEAFLIRFFHRHQCSEVISRPALPFRGTRIQLRPWRIESHAEHVDMPHHVRLCLEGLLLQAWDAQAVASAIGTNCSIDYIEPASCLKTDTEALCLWAWATCPSKIPRVNWITIPAREGGEPVYGRRGLQHRVLLHLSILEQKVGGRTVLEGFTWRRNIVDGETVPRDRRERISRPAPRHDRRGSDDDEDRRRGGDRRGRDAAACRSSLGARIRRSLSRNHREEPRNQDRGWGDRDRREDRGNPSP